MVPNQQMKKNILINYTGKYEGAFLASVYIKGVIVKQENFGSYSGSIDIKAIYQIEIARDFTIRKPGVNLLPRLPCFMANETGASFVSYTKNRSGVAGSLIIKSSNHQIIKLRLSPALVRDTRNSGASFVCHEPKLSGWFSHHQIIKSSNYQIKIITPPALVRDTRNSGASFVSYTTNQN